MAPPSTASGSSKRDHPGDDSSGPSKRHDHRAGSNIGDDTDDENGETMDEKPYGEAQEAYPQHPTFDKALVALDARFVLLTKQLQKTLVDHSFVREGLQNIKLRADAAVKPPTPEHIMVAMVGATAAGKSSLLNTVTDTPHLAKALSAGESCTSLPTYYMHRLPWQTFAFAAEICYYNVEKCRKLLEELLEHYNFYTFEKEEDWTSDQRSEYS